MACLRKLTGTLQNLPHNICTHRSTTNELKLHYNLNRKLKHIIDPLKKKVTGLDLAQICPCEQNTAQLRPMHASEAVRPSSSSRTCPAAPDGQQGARRGRQRRSDDPKRKGRCPLARLRCGDLRGAKMMKNGGQCSSHTCSTSRRRRGRGCGW